MLGSAFYFEGENRMKKQMTAILIVAMLMLSGCGAGEQAQTPTNMPSQAPSEVPATPTAEPTAAPTEMPATPTAAPTSTPTPEPTAEPAQPSGDAVVLGDYIGMQLYDATQAEVDAKIKELLLNFVEYAEVDRPAQNGDIVNINYVGKLDGVAFAGGTDDSEEGTDLELGSESFIDGFEEGLIGAVSGEVRDLALTFPEEYHSAELAGKSVIFTVTVNSVVSAVYPEVTDAFVSENLKEGMTAAQLRQTVYEELRWERLTAQVTEQLLATSVIKEYPENALQAEADAVINMYMMYAQYYGAMYGVDAEMMLPSFGFANTAELEAYAYAYAEYMVNTTMLMNAVAKQEGIVLTEEVYAERVPEYAISYGYSDVASFEEDYGVLAIEEAILFDIVFEYIIDNAIIIGEN